MEDGQMFSVMYLKAALRATRYRKVQEESTALGLRAMGEKEEKGKRGKRGGG